MATFQPKLHQSGRAALLACACVTSALTAAEPASGSPLSQREIERRNLSTMEAQELLKKGDESYQAGRYGDAVEAYAGAREMIPNAPLTAELRAATTERYVQASIEHAKNLSRKGDVAAAKAAVEKVLAPSVAPDHALATLALAELNDPIRTNPALTAEHAANVDQVRRLLYTAEGAFNLGKFDQAKREYENVIRIDPANAAARRGMERVAAAKSGYYDAARDEARAVMLGQVGEAWEIKPIAPELAPGFFDPSETQQSDFIPVANKLDRIIIPSIQMEQASLEEALELLRVRSAEFDTLEIDPARKGVNFAVNLGDPSSEISTQIRARRFDLQLTQVPLSQILKYLTDLTGTTYSTDDFSVLIRPVGTVTNELVSRTYRVPPDFLSSISGSSTEATASNDPFAEAPSGGGLLARQLGIKEALEQQGISFPEGAIASLNSNLLSVVNTPLNQDIIQQIVDGVAQTEPVSVAVRVTMIRVQQTRLEELGFDWLLDNFGLAGGGGDTLDLSGGTQGTGGDLTDIPLALPTTRRNPITAGNRSGSEAVDGNAIDALLENNITGRQSGGRAPGILSVNGYFNNTTAQMVMRGLDQKKGVDVMYRPSTITRSGQASSVYITREFIYPTEYEPPEIPNSVGIVDGIDVGYDPGSVPVTPANPTAFETKQIGVSLEVLPVADANRRYVDLTLKPSFIDFDGFINYGSPIRAGSPVPGQELGVITENAILMPVFSSQNLNTQVTIADGATIVLGGLIQQRVQNVDDKTPILGNIPVVGRMFQSKVSQPMSSAIIFFVNVELLDPTGRPYRDR